MQEALKQSMKDEEYRMEQEAIVASMTYQHNEKLSKIQEVTKLERSLIEWAFTENNCNVEQTIDYLLSGLSK